MPRELVSVLLLAGCLASCAQETRSDRVILFAASSTTDAFESVASELRTRTGVELVLNLASSSVLARQIAAGAPADLFVSASPDWMDELESTGLVEPNSRIALLSNQLVLVVPSGSDLKLEDPRDLPRLLAGKRLAIGDPDSVPAGQYAARALRALGIFDALAPSFVPAKDVRAALALVARGEVAAAIVYSTDTRVADVRVLAPLDAGSIVYPLAMVSGRRRPAVERVLEYLQGPEAASTFSSLGFVVIERQP